LTVKTTAAPPGFTKRARAPTKSSVVDVLNDHSHRRQVKPLV
jgi:hypothetical protein